MLKSKLSFVAASALFALLATTPASAASCGESGSASFWSCQNPINLKPGKPPEAGEARTAGVGQFNGSYRDSAPSAPAEKPN